MAAASQGSAQGKTQGRGTSVFKGHRRTRRGAKDSCKTDSQHQTRSPGVEDRLHIHRLDPENVLSHKVISLCHKTASPKVVPRMLQGGQAQMPLTLLHTVKLSHLQAARGKHLSGSLPSAGGFSTLSLPSAATETSGLEKMVNFTQTLGTGRLGPRVTLTHHP